MLVVMQSHATAEQIGRVLEAIQGMSLTPHPMPGPTRTAIGITGNTQAVDPRTLEVLPGVSELIRVTRPCEVGEWIHKKAGWTYRASRHFSQVKEKHATFHREAGKVVALIKAGKLVEAQREIESGVYSWATHDLTGQLSQWLRELLAEPKRRMHHP